MFDLLNKIKIDSSPGPDIYPKFVYKVRHEILEPLCYLFSLMGPIPSMQKIEIRPSAKE